MRKSLVAEMKLIKSEFGGFDLSDWNILDAVDPVAKELERVVATQVTKAVRKVFAIYPPLLEFADLGEYEANPRKPLMLMVSLSLGDVGDYGVDYSCSLEAVVDELIETTGHPDDPEICAEVAVRLRELADKLDRASSQ
jgi:hypothetical protein